MTLTSRILRLLVILWLLLLLLLILLLLLLPLLQFSSCCLSRQGCPNYVLPGSLSA
jgi:hypothetical protein